MRSSLFKGLGVIALLVALTLAMAGCDPTPEMVEIKITSTEGGHVEEKVDDEWVKEDVETERSVEVEASIQLKAVADEDYEFTGWEVEGAEHGDLEEEEITLTNFEEGAEITATFEEVVVVPEEYTLDLAKVGEGTIEVDGVEVELPFSEDYEEGTEVTLEAKAAEGYEFKEWEGIEEDDALITVTMDEDLDLTAVFEELPALDTIVVDGPEVIEIPAGEPATAEFTAKAYDQFGDEFPVDEFEWDVVLEDNVEDNVAIDDEGNLTVTKEAVEEVIVVTAAAEGVEGTLEVSLELDPDMENWISAAWYLVDEFMEDFEDNGDYVMEEGEHQLITKVYYNFFEVNWTSENDAVDIDEDGLATVSPQAYEEVGDLVAELTYVGGASASAEGYQLTKAYEVTVENLPYITEVPEVDDISVPFSTDLEDVKAELPSELEVELSDGTMVTVDVEWASEDYVAEPEEAPYEFDFVGTLECEEGVFTNREGETAEAEVTVLMATLDEILTDLDWSEDPFEYDTSVEDVIAALPTEVEVSIVESDTTFTLVIEEWEGEITADLRDRVGDHVFTSAFEEHAVVDVEEEEAEATIRLDVLETTFLPGSVEGGVNEITGTVGREVKEGQVIRVRALDQDGDTVDTFDIDARTELGEDTWVDFTLDDVDIVSGYYDVQLRIDGVTEQEVEEVEVTAAEGPLTGTLDRIHAGGEVMVIDGVEYTVAAMPEFKKYLDRMSAPNHQVLGSEVTVMIKDNRVTDLMEIVLEDKEFTARAMNDMVNTADETTFYGLTIKGQEDAAATVVQEAGVQADVDGNVVYATMDELTLKNIDFKVYTLVVGIHFEWGNGYIDKSIEATMPPVYGEYIGDEIVLRNVSFDGEVLYLGSFRLDAQFSDITATDWIECWGRDSQVSAESITGDFVIMGRGITLHDTPSITGNVTVEGDDATLEDLGDIVGDVAIYGDDAKVENVDSIEGNVFVEGDDADLDNLQVHGNVKINGLGVTLLNSDIMGENADAALQNEITAGILEIGRWGGPTAAGFEADNVTAEYLMIFGEDLDIQNSEFEYLVTGPGFYQQAGANSLFKDVTFGDIVPIDTVTNFPAPFAWTVGAAIGDTDRITIEVNNVTYDTVTFGTEAAYDLVIDADGYTRRNTDVPANLTIYGNDATFEDLDVAGDLGFDNDAETAVFSDVIFKGKVDLDGADSGVDTAPSFTGGKMLDSLDNIVANTSFKDIIFDFDNEIILVEVDGISFESCTFQNTADPYTDDIVVKVEPGTDEVTFDGDTFTEHAQFHVSGGGTDTIVDLANATFEEGSMFTVDGGSSHVKVTNTTFAGTVSSSPDDIVIEHDGDLTFDNVTVHVAYEYGDPYFENPNELIIEETVAEVVIKDSDIYREITVKDVTDLDVINSNFYKDVNLGEDNLTAEFKDGKIVGDLTVHAGDNRVYFEGTELQGSLDMKTKTDDLRLNRVSFNSEEDEEITATSDTAIVLNNVSFDGEEVVIDDEGDDLVVSFRGKIEGNDNLVVKSIDVGESEIREDAVIEKATFELGINGIDARANTLIRESTFTVAQTFNSTYTAGLTFANNVFDEDVTAEIDLHFTENTFAKAVTIDDNTLDERIHFTGDTFQNTLTINTTNASFTDITSYDDVDVDVNENTKVNGWTFIEIDPTEITVDLAEQVELELKGVIDWTQAPDLEFDTDATGSTIEDDEAEWIGPDGEGHKPF